MLDAIKQAVLTVMRVPPEPHDPMGDVSALRVFRPAIRYLYYRYLAWAGKELLATIFIFAAFGGLAGGLAQDPGVAPWVPVAIVSAGVGLFFIQLIFSAFIVWLEYQVRWYKVTDRSLRIRYGVLNMREHTVTFANIQNVSMTQGPLQRMFGIADVLVDTAGGGGSAQAAGGGLALQGGLIGMLVREQAQQQMFNMHRAVFRGVDNAEEIRDLMMARLSRVRDAGLGEPAPVADALTGRIIPSQQVSPGINWGLAHDTLAAFRQEAAALRHAAESLSR